MQYSDDLYINENYPVSDEQFTGTGFLTTGGLPPARSCDNISSEEDDHGCEDVQDEGRGAR